MQFDSLAAALDMGGHGGYVWSVYLVAALVVLFLLLGPVLRSRNIIVARRGQLRRERAQEEKVEKQDKQEKQEKEIPIASSS